jgi:hypothetical protein
MPFRMRSHNNNNDDDDDGIPFLINFSMILRLTWYMELNWKETENFKLAFVFL